MALHDRKYENLDNFLSRVRVQIKRDFSSGIESENTLTEQDIQTIRELRNLRICAGSRPQEVIKQRENLLDCLLEHGATSGLYRVIRDFGCPGCPSWPLLLDLWSYLPRKIVKKWIENARTTEDGVPGNLVCYAYERGDTTILLQMLEYGASCQTKNDEGTEIWDLKIIGGIKLFLCTVRYPFTIVKTGSTKLDLPTEFLDEFLATLHTRNSDGLTILQLALKCGHLHTAAHIIDSVIHEMPESFVLEVSETMSYDELLDGSKHCLKEIREKLEELHGEDCEVLVQASMVFESALQVLKLWSEYERNLGHFYGDPHLTIIEEVLELLLLRKLVRPTLFDRVARLREIWEKQEKHQCAKSFVVDLSQMTIVAPIEAFVKAIYGAKLHQAAEIGDLAAAAEFIREGAKLNLRDRYTGIKLLHKLVDRGDEGMAILLLDNKADPRLEYYHPQSLLHLAVEKESINMVEAMLRNFEDIKARRDYLEKVKDGLSALQFAAQLGRLEICKCLLRYQANYARGKHDNPGLDYSAITLTGDSAVRQIFVLIDWLFWRVSVGDAECLQTIKAFKSDELLAVCSARNQKGYDLVEVARINKHFRIADEIYNFVLYKTNKEISSAKT